MRIKSNFLKIFLSFSFFLLSLFLLKTVLNIFYFKIIPVKLDEVKILVEIADTPEKRTKGLSGRRSLSRDRGMLFVFSSPQIASFWMKDMYFPIDLFFIDEGCKVTEIFNNIDPKSFPQMFTSRKPIKYALEVKSDFLEKHLLKEGSQLKIPKIINGLSCKGK